MRGKGTDNGIKRIARQLDLSPSTVSRALNGVYGVSRETRDKVLEAASRLGYVPHMGAKQLVGKGSDLIGVFAPRFPIEGSPGFLSLFGSLQQELNARGKDVMQFSVPLLDCPDGRLSAAMGSRGFDGCILLPAIDSAHPVLLEALHMQVPCVNFEDAVGARCSSAVSADREGGRLAGRLLAAKGHRQIGFIGGPAGLRICMQRYEGFHEALGEFGILPDPALREDGNFTGQSGAAAIRQLLRRAPDLTAVYCANDLMAMGAVMELADMGLSVPERLSVVGHDGEFFTAYTNPPMTTVAHDFRSMAAAAADMMMELLGGAAGRRTAVSPLLLERRSTAALPQSESLETEDAP